jgi:cyclopropane-fatty-acyl-phospholipid synthase
MKSKQLIETLLESADVKINGVRPWDIQVHNDKFYDRIMSQGTMGMGESYMDGWWDVPELDQFFFRILRANLRNKITLNWPTLKIFLKSKIINLQKKSRAFEIAEKHYDLDNELYQTMLDETLAYTCGYWKNAVTLKQAQEAKLDLVCRKLGLKPGMKVLDIGCGWGSFMKYASEKYGVSCVGITVSKEQMALGKDFCKGLPVEFKFMDYREITGKFDRVVSIGMFEAVGYKNFRKFMGVISKCLKEDGLFLLHTIGSDKSCHTGEPWVNKYIFPNGMLPSISQISKSVEGLFVTEDVHSFGQYYTPTLLAWFKNFDKNWNTLNKKYDKRFYRMWKYYLLSFAGTFQARHTELWQIVFSPRGVVGGYESIR